MLGRWALMWMAAGLLAACGGGGGGGNGGAGDSQGGFLSEGEIKVRVVADQTSLPTNPLHFPAQIGSPFTTTITAFVDDEQGNPITNGTEVVFAVTGNASTTLTAGALYFLDGATDHEDDNGNPLAFRNGTVETASGVATMHFTSSDSPGEVRISVTVADPNRSNRTQGAAVTLQVGSNSSNGRANSIVIGADSTVIATQNSGGQTSTILQPIIYDSAGQAIKNPGSGINNVKVEVVSGPGGGEKVVGTNAAGVQKEGNLVYVRSTNGIAQFSAVSGVLSGTIGIRVTADGKDNNVDNGIDNPITNVIGIAIVPGGDGGNGGTDPLAITTESPLPDATANVSYAAILEATGGRAPYFWSLDSGQLPPGITLDASGALVGTPTQSGSFSFIAKVADQTAQTARKAFTLNVQAPVGPVITTTSLPNGQVNVSYGTVVRAEGGAVPYTWSVSSGVLPQGLVLNPLSGAISGIPTQAGSFSFLIQVTDANGLSYVAPFTIIVDPTSGGDGGIIDCSGSGDGVCEFTVTEAGAVRFISSYDGPNDDFGLFVAELLDSDAEFISLLFATNDPVFTGETVEPLEPGDYLVRVGSDGDWLLRVILPGAGGGPGQPLQITTTSIPDGQLNVSYAATLGATGGITPYRWSIDSGSLPEGLDLNPDTGAISGTPTRAGSFSFIVRVTDSQGASSVQSLTLTVNVPDGPTITTESLPDAKLNVSYSAVLRAEGGALPYTWSIDSGSLPNGLELDSATGAISGVATEAGSFSFVVRVTTSNQAFFVAPFTIQVTQTDSPIISTDTVPNAELNVPYSTVFRATGGIEPYTWTIDTGLLPPGLALNRDSGALAGTPTDAGTYSFILRVTDANGGSFIKAFSMDVVAPEGPIITTEALPEGAIFSNYSAVLRAEGGTTPYTWRVESLSRLPQGLRLAADTGAITGAPQEAGTFNLVIRVTDANGASYLKPFDLRINNPDGPVIITETLPDGVFLESYSQTLRATGGVFPLRWTVEPTTPLPPGLTLGRDNGVISGVATQPGTFRFSVRVTDANQAFYIQSYTVRIVQPDGPQIDTELVPDGSLNVPYAFVLRASGGRQPYRWTLADGTQLPPGLFLGALDGAITGTPVQAGRFAFVVQVTDASGANYVAAFNLTVTQEGPDDILEIPPITLPEATIGVFYSTVLSATGGLPPYTWSLPLGAGGFPPGLSLNAISGIISGTPLSLGTFNFVVEVEDSNGASFWAPVSIIVAPVGGGGGGGQLVLQMFELDSNPPSPDCTPGETNVIANADCPYRLTAKVSNPDGSPVSAAVVTFASERGFVGFIPATATALTGADGIAQIFVEGVTIGADTITATTTVGGVEVTGTFNVDVQATGGGVAPNVPSISVRLCETATYVAPDPDNGVVGNCDETNEVGGSSPAVVEATVLHGDGTPVEATVVAYATGSLGILVPASGTGLTNNQGISTIRLEAGTDLGADFLTATATVNGLEISAFVGFQVTSPSIGPGVPANLGLSTDKQAVPTGSDNPNDAATITATVLDENNAVVEGVDVFFSADGGQLSAATVTTDANGQAQVLFTGGTIDKSNRVVTITAITGGLQPRSIPIQVIGSTLRFQDTTNASLEVGGTPLNEVLIAEDAIPNPVVGAQLCLMQEPALGNPGGLFLRDATTGDALTTDCPLDGFSGWVCGTNGNAAECGQTDVNGQLPVTVGGAAAGSVTLMVTGLNASASKEYIVSAVGQVLEIIFPVEPVSAVDLGAIQEVQVSAPGATRVRFATSLGEWTNNNSSVFICDSTIADPCYLGNDIFTAKLTADFGGTAVVLAQDVDNTLRSDSIVIPFAAVVADAGRVILDASPRTLPVSNGAVQFISNVVATVLTDDPQPQPVAGASVSFTVLNATGGGETVSPPVVVTGPDGKARTTFTSGTVASGQDGIVVKAKVLNANPGCLAGTPPPLVNDPAAPDPCTDYFNIVISDEAGSVVIGTSTQVGSTPDNTAYLLPMSVLVSDSNGSAVSNTTVSLSTWPLFYSTGFRDHDDNNDIDNGVAIITDTFDNEDVNENLILDPGEDFNGNGILTPPNSAAGALPATVQTDETGLAAFELAYLKNQADWIVDRVRASALVQGTEVVGELIFRLPPSIPDVAGELLPDSPYNATCPYVASVSPSSVDLVLDGPPVPVTLSLFYDGGSAFNNEAVGRPILFAATTQSGSFVATATTGVTQNLGQIDPGTGNVVGQLISNISAVGIGLLPSGGSATVFYQASCAPQVTVTVNVTN